MGSAFARDIDEGPPILLSHQSLQVGEDWIGNKTLASRTIFLAPAPPEKRDSAHDEPGTARQGNYREYRNEYWRNASTLERVNQSRGIQDLRPAKKKRASISSVRTIARIRDISARIHRTLTR